MSMDGRLATRVLSNRWFGGLNEELLALWAIF